MLKVCLEEELRNFGNRCPNKWSEGLRKTFEEVGDRDSLEEIRSENGKKEWKEKLARGMKIKKKQG